MRKNKLERFAETATFKNFIQTHPYFSPESHELKGNWANHFFKNSNPVILELGCGKGEYTLGLALKNPDQNYLGVDIKGARMWRGAKTAIENNIGNAGFLRTHIGQIEKFFAKNEISGIWITFPDPQPQKPRTRKRLTSKPFLCRYENILTPDAIIHLKTDNKPFFDFTLETISCYGHKLHFYTHDLYGSGLTGDATEIQTFYEKMFLDQNQKICYLNFSL